jgi:hypothetical protein
MRPLDSRRLQIARYRYVDGLLRIDGQEPRLFVDSYKLT